MNKDTMNRALEAPMKADTGYEVCVDCCMAIANADYSGMTEERANEVSSALHATVGYWVLDCGEDCEGFFSWSSCDCCGSPLGGDRHPAAILRDEAPTVNEVVTVHDENGSPAHGIFTLGDGVIVG